MPPLLKFKRHGRREGRKGEGSRNETHRRGSESGLSLEQHLPSAHSAGPGADGSEEPSSKRGSAGLPGRRPQQGAGPRRPSPTPGDGPGPRAPPAAPAQSEGIFAASRSAAARAPPPRATQRGPRGSRRHRPAVSHRKPGWDPPPLGRGFGLGSRSPRPTDTEPPGRETTLEFSASHRPRGVSRPGGSRKTPIKVSPRLSHPRRSPRLCGAPSPELTSPQRRGKAEEEAKRRRRPERRSRRRPAASMALRPLLHCWTSQG
ncbi:translation initiation factor IF-2-like [Tympanuchus pallidicinctus]|uniref:translation initiation factor IF-2-like n=1 Tax=Tympanuchus pallidicinctus TaxID=109042 RepID=UPI0022870C1A|nr:translation initiation factor IF-2-like [Tympanuchus pallidicinctus]